MSLCVRAQSSQLRKQVSPICDTKLIEILISYDEEKKFRTLFNSSKTPDEINRFVLLRLFVSLPMEMPDKLTSPVGMYIKLDGRCSTISEQCQIFPGDFDFQECNLNFTFKSQLFCGHQKS